MKKQLTYEEELEHNEMIFDEMLKKVRPDLWVLKDLIDKTKMNPLIIFKFIRQVQNLALGTGWGTVELVMENGIVRIIRGAESDKIGERAIQEDI